MTSLFVAVLLFATPEPVKVAAPAFSLAGVDPKLGAVFQERFVSRLGAADLRVTSQQDIAQVLGLERQKQLLGCSTESSSCLAELAGALGVDLVLSGSVARSESGFIASIRVIRADDGQLVASPNTRTRTEGEFLDWLDATADSLRATILQKLRGKAVSAPVATVSVAPGPTSPVVRWIPGIIGGVLIVTGGVMTGLWLRDYQWLWNSTASQPPPLSGDTPSSVARAGHAAGELRRARRGRGGDRCVDHLERGGAVGAGAGVDRARALGRGGGLLGSVSMTRICWLAVLTASLVGCQWGDATCHAEQVHGVGSCNAIAPDGGMFDDGGMLGMVDGGTNVITGTNAFSVTLALRYVVAQDRSIIVLNTQSMPLTCPMAVLAQGNPSLVFRAASTVTAGSTYTCGQSPAFVCEVNGAPVSTGTVTIDTITTTEWTGTFSAVGPWSGGFRVPLQGC
jgi:hypothetical protein